MEGRDDVFLLLITKPKLRHDITEMMNRIHFFKLLLLASFVSWETPKTILAWILTRKKEPVHEGDATGTLWESNCTISKFWWSNKGFLCMVSWNAYKAWRKWISSSSKKKIHHLRHVKNKVELWQSEMFPRSVQPCILWKSVKLIIFRNIKAQWLGRVTKESISRIMESGRKSHKGAGFWLATPFSRERRE